jgi:hypothetical protein
MPYRSGASALMYHREVKTIKAGAMIASHIPKRVRTAMIEAVSWHVAEQQRMIPHSKMLYPRTFETGKFWRSIPARLSSASDDSDGSYIVTLRPFSDNIADEECCCCPREVLTLHMEVFLQTHDIRVLHRLLISLVLLYRGSSYLTLIATLSRNCSRYARERVGMIR